MLSTLWRSGGLGGHTNVSALRLKTLNELPAQPLLKLVTAARFTSRNLHYVSWRVLACRVAYRSSTPAVVAIHRFTFTFTTHKALCHFRVSLLSRCASTVVASTFSCAARSERIVYVLLRIYKDICLQASRVVLRSALYNRRTNGRTMRPLESACS